MMILDILDQVRSIPGAAAKAEFLKKEHTPLLDQIVTDAMDPSITYGVTAKDIGIQPHTPGTGPAVWYEDFHKLLGRLAARELTGNAAVEAIKNCLSQQPENVQQLLLRVLDRDLGLGVGWRVYREEVLGIKGAFKVALAQHLEKVKGVDPVDGTWFASRKCDGLRLITILNEDGSVTFKSRQDKEFKTLENLKPAVKRFCAGLTGAWVLDGELCKVDADGDEDFKAICKEARRKDFSVDECCYQVFDIITYDEFCEGKSKDILSKRFERLNQLHTKYIEEPHEKCWIKPLWQERLTSQADFDRWSAMVEKGGWEGFMIRKDIIYNTYTSRDGRTKELLKIKKFDDAEYVVEGVETGTMTTSLPGEGLKTFEGVTALLITHKGYRVHVGAGLTRDQRISWFKDPSLIVGKTITVKYFEETTNAQGGISLRFPTLKFVYENGRDC